MASYKELRAAPPEQKPVEVAISGLEEKLLIHTFTMDEIAVVENVEADDPEEKIRKQVFIFLEGKDAVPTAEDCAELGRIFAGFQIREIYTKALKLNGFGPDALREAEKN